MKGCMSHIDDVYEAEKAHLDTFWPDRPHEDFAWTLGPVSGSLPRMRVRRISPVRPRDPWVYVTIGAWEATADGPHATEFVLLSATENPLHVELLSMVANFHADPNYRLGVGSVMNIGRPWVGESSADHLLVTLPYPFGPELEICNVGDRHVRYLWLVPITGSEAVLVRDAGLEALEKLLDERQVDVISPTRSSVV